MKKISEKEYLHQPVSSVARKDVATLHQDVTVQQALNEIRSHGLGERIVYFYVVNSESRLVGVVPTRRLLTASLELKVSDVMVKRVMSILESTSILEAHELLAHHKFMALPVVNQQGHIVGVIDIGMFAEEDFNVAERSQIESVFESIGFRVSQVREASPFRAFRFRFPWLISTLVGGTICALLTSIYDTTLAKSLVLAFFLTLVLGLGESVSMQSMTITIQTLRSRRPTLQWYLVTFWREAGTSLLLGAACGLVVGLTVWLWRGTGMAAVTIGGSIFFIIFVSCFFGFSIPALLHALKLDPKIAAGPVTLAIADICTIIIYFSLASLLL